MKRKGDNLRRRKRRCGEFREEGEKTKKKRENRKINREEKRGRTEDI